MGGRGPSENFPGLIRPSNAHGTQTGQNRRALSAIDINVINNQKRGVLAEKNAASKKNPTVPLHRPVTRRFAAQLVVKEKQEVKPNQTSDCVIVDAEDDVPMFVQHTEAMLVEIDRMDAEVEMEENIDEDEAMMDVDASDKKNPLAVTEYINDIYAFYKKTEGSSFVPPNYMVQQPDINDRMRGILIDWLIEVHYRFELMDETLYLTVNLIDRFLAVQSIERKRLQLVGVTAMLLACKYEEVSVPVVEDLVLISDKAYSRAEVLDMEKLIINTLQFNLSLPTPYVFMRRFLKAAESEKKLEPLSFYILELCLVEYEMLRFRPSHLAAAAIFTAQCTLSGCEIWSRTCQSHTSYTKDQLMECARLMVALHQNAGSGKLTGVYKKYSSSKFGYAAKMEPAVFLKEQQ